MNGHLIGPVSMSLTQAFVFYVRRDCWLLLGSLVYIYFYVSQGFLEKQNQYYIYDYIFVNFILEYNYILYNVLYHELYTYSMYCIYIFIYVFI